MLGGIWAVGIRFYRRVLRKRINRRCLFSVSCSEFVLREAQRCGFRAGTRAFVSRCMSCRTDYDICFADHQKSLVPKYGLRIHFNELSTEMQAELDSLYLATLESISHRAVGASTCADTSPARRFLR